MEISEKLIKVQLMKNLSNKQRKFFWLKLSELNLNSTNFKSDVDLPKDHLNQIHFDVLRTKQWKGITY